MIHPQTERRALYVLGDPDSGLLAGRSAPEEGFFSSEAKKVSALAAPPAASSRTNAGRTA